MHKYTHTHTQVYFDKGKKLIAFHWLMRLHGFCLHHWGIFAIHAGGFKGWHHNTEDGAGGMSLIENDVNKKWLRQTFTSHIFDVGAR